MKTKHFLVFTGFLTAVAVGVFPAMVASTLAAGEQSDQQQMQSPQASKTDAQIQISPVALRRIQEELSQQGHDAGTPDGIWGKSTASAVKNFQKSKNLDPTGNLNIETIQALNIPEILDGSLDEQASAQMGQKQAEEKKAIHPGAQIYISPSALRNVQQSLQNQGFEVGQADGLWGDKTQQAVRSFQRENEMEPTGDITVGLLESLGMSQEMAALGFGGQSRMAQQQQQSMDQMETEARGYYGRPDQAQEDESAAAADQSQAEGQGAPLYAGTDLIQQIQQALSDKGHDPGQVDGKWSASTAKAVGRFQQSQNLAPTGTLTLATVQKLVGGNAVSQPQMDTGGGPQQQ